MEGTATLGFSDNDTGTVMIKSDISGNPSGTVIITDTNTEGEAENDAFGIDTVIITSNEDGTGTVVIKQ